MLTAVLADQPRPSGSMKSVKKGSLDEGRRVEEIGLGEEARELAEPFGGRGLRARVVEHPSRPRRSAA